jgi:hypothetical protein
MTMKNSDERMSADDVDPTLSARYRQLADESAPVSLDRAVLRSARHAASKNEPAGWQPEWFKPAAFVTMLALSLAIVLELNETNILTSPFSPSGQILPANGTGNPFEDAADAATRQIRDADAAAANEVTNPGPVIDSATDTDPVTSDVSLLPVDQRCSDEQRATVATWWQCIESLESRGASDAAEAELNELLSSFPGFVAPD